MLWSAFGGVELLLGPFVFGPFGQPWTALRSFLRLDENWSKQKTLNSVTYEPNQAARHSSLDLPQYLRSTGSGARGECEI